MPDLVRARLNGRDTNMSRFLAERSGAQILDEPTHGHDGAPRPESRANGRPSKPRTTVERAAAQKTTSDKSSDGKQAATPAQNDKEQDNGR